MLDVVLALVGAATEDIPDIWESTYLLGGLVEGPDALGQEGVGIGAVAVAGGFLDAAQASTGA